MIDVDLKGALILLVDDFPQNLELLIDALETSGAEIRIAGSGREALERVQHIHPDLILLDVKMEDLDGFATCRRLKENRATADIPIIFMTALTDTIDELKGFEMGAVDYITKPLKLDTVLVRVKTQITLLQQKNQLAEINATKDRFFSIIAHDLRNPLHGISLAANLLRKRCNQGKLEEALELIQALEDSTQNVYQLLENLLHWSRLQQGSLEFRPVRVDLSAMVNNDIAELYRMGARQKEIRMICALNPGLHVFADRDMVHTILRNLVSNALKFTHPGGEIRVTAAKVDEYIQVSVADTGTGIDAEDRERVFRMDQKLARRGTAGETGSGLGLLLCQDLIARNGGAIHLQSEIEKGTTFSFTLPMADRIPSGDNGKPVRTDDFD